MNNLGYLFAANLFDAFFKHSPIAMPVSSVV